MSLTKFYISLLYKSIIELTLKLCYKRGLPILPKLEKWDLYLQYDPINFRKQTQL